MEMPSDEFGDRPTTLVTLGPPGSSNDASRPDNKKAEGRTTSKPLLLMRTASEKTSSRRLSLKA
jgi:hypothetical protein